MIEHARHESKVSFFKTVKRLRDDRCSMVQNKDQYTFLHEAVLEAYSREKAVLDLTSFDLAFPSRIVPTKSNKRIDKEFKTVQHMRELLEPHTHHTASLEENRSKNRNPYALPADQHLVFLAPQEQDRDSYINAVYMPTMLNARGCVLTQHPLPETVKNFWRLVDTCGVTSIVFLGETLTSFWPMKTGETIKIDPYTLSLSHVEQQGASLTCYYLMFQNKHEAREVRLLHYQDWKSKLPANTVDLLQLIVTLVDTMKGKGQGPLLIQCFDGAARSGLLCAVCDMIIRLIHHRVVDVYSAVRSVHYVRPQAVTSVEEYRFCYEVAQQYEYSNRVYANT
ncbi:receptor-type tyrosine-protein phosphatase kappa-like [Pomacea canaliculata]|uniref:receptor-type tyrosine-protein phosphatase kappa-like n=1 Tax=Pomacea canaliculata TaxID=400727 RepID=UPI000D7285DF|nr:receptor-type tyrosine-protein phosphatase kappa-like [Pomacea canaliculata]